MSKEDDEARELVSELRAMARYDGEIDMPQIRALVNAAAFIESKLPPDPRRSAVEKVLTAPHLDLGKAADLQLGLEEAFDYGFTAGREYHEAIEMDRKQPA
jgi:hypothetical protein